MTVDETPLVAADDLPLLLFHAACDAKASGAPDATVRWRRLARVLRLLAAAGPASPSPRPRWLGGDEVMRLLKLSPGPRVGSVLDELLDAEQSGQVRSRRQALEFVRRRGPAIPGRN